MQTFRTKDNKVTKFIHEDGSETCIKTVYSVDYKPNADTGEVDVKVTDRNKYSVFISVSQGCAMACPFCYLTIDDVPFKNVGPDSIKANVIDAILKETENEDAGLSDRFMKICWMGMGEAILRPHIVHLETLELLDWAMQYGYTKGLDGVDISTVLPKIKNDEWISRFIELNKELKNYPLNANNKNVVNRERGDLVEYKNRSRFRLFYSLHSAIQESREVVVPNAMPIAEAIPKLQKLESGGIQVIIHHMFLDGMNDSEEELEALVEFMKNFPNSELRILRYNRHDRSNIVESSAFEQCVCYIQGKIKNIKVQVSYGKDVKSACGQFIYNDTKALEDLKI